MSHEIYPYGFKPILEIIKRNKILYHKYEKNFTNDEYYTFSLQDSKKYDIDIMVCYEKGKRKIPEGIIYQEDLKKLKHLFKLCGKGNELDHIEPYIK